METNKIFSKVKENWSIILFIAPFLGGCLQIYELSSISFSFIRFFSVSQLIADGILVLVFVVFVFGIPFGRLWLLDFCKEKPFSSLFYLLDLVIISLTTNFGIFMYNNNNFKDDRFYWILSIVLILIIYFLLNGNVNQKVKKVIIFLTFISCFFVFPYINKKFKQFIDLPNNLENTQVSNSVINKKNQTKVIYYNDKYVFLEHNFKNKKLIQIVKFDDYFFKNK
jgi:hypothetical protein